MIDIFNFIDSKIFNSNLYLLKTNHKRFIIQMLNQPKKY